LTLTPQPQPTPVDKEDPKALTLEELKKKAEDDRIKGLTEAKKEIIMKELRNFKSEFRNLLQRFQFSIFP
jgi:hypothetical protein